MGRWWGHRIAALVGSASRSSWMTHRFALAVSLLLAGSVPALAQTHPAHPPGQPHDRSAHPAMDPQEHARMHGALLGNWTGTLTFPDGRSTKVDLTAANDSHGALTLTITSSQPNEVGAASGIVFEGQTLRWTQALSERACKASAVVAAKTAQVAETMKGTMKCPEREIAFALEKTN